MHNATDVTISDSFFQPKYANKVYKLLLYIDQFGHCRWVGRLAFVGTLAR